MRPCLRKKGRKKGSYQLINDSPVSEAALAKVLLYQLLNINSILPFLCRNLAKVLCCKNLLFMKLAQSSNWCRRVNSRNKEHTPKFSFTFITFQVPFHYLLNTLLLSKQKAQQKYHRLTKTVDQHFKLRIYYAGLKSQAHHQIMTA